MSLKCSYEKVCLPLLFERYRRIMSNYNRKGNMGLQTETTNIYLPTNVYGGGPPRSQAVF